MPTGSCLCGKINISFDSDPIVKALCHCKDCQKISGSAYSVNIMVNGEGFEVTGAPSKFKKTADSGKPITSYFCPDCGTTLYRDGETFGNKKVVKAGVLDDKGALADAKPSLELFAPERVPWVAQVAGTEDKTAMP